jgi:protein-tyrosine phosphatase
VIDIHNHILPGLDDGAKDMPEALAMAEMAASDGITHIVCTPHAFPDVYFPELERVREAFGAFKASLAETRIPMDLFLGHDIHLVPEPLDWLKSGRVLTLNGGRYCLVEPPEFFSPAELESILFVLRREGYRPIITHPERYAAFLDAPGLVDRLAEQGNFMQVTAGALRGRFGRPAQAFCRRMARRRLIHLVASDAHSPRRRHPGLRKAFLVLREWAGDEDANTIMENAAAVLEDRDIAPFPPRDERTWLQRLSDRLFNRGGRRGRGDG